MSLRITKETQMLMNEPIPGINAIADVDDVRYFHCAITGPEGSPYEGGVFQLKLVLPDDYPLSAPRVHFATKVFHPNIDSEGDICLDILNDKWTPGLQIRTVLISIQALLSAPNPDDPLDKVVGELWNNDEDEAIRKAKEWTKMYAK